MLINGILTNAEVWYNFSSNEIQEFEQLDQLYFAELLGVPKTTPCEAYYLELGVLPIPAIIKGRRTNYLHSILRRDTDSMLYKFFITQWFNPTKGDWSLQVKEDLKLLEIPCTFDFIKSKSKETFKRIVKKQVKIFALKMLKSKQQKHSKIAKLSYKTLKMQSYFTSMIKTEEKRTIFRFRVRMERFGENFRGGASSIICPLCFSHLDKSRIKFPVSCYQKRNRNRNFSEIYKEDIETKAIQTRK